MRHGKEDPQRHGASMLIGFQINSAKFQLFRHLTNLLPKSWLLLSITTA